MYQNEKQKKTTETVTQDNIVYLINFEEKRADIASSNFTKSSIIAIPYSIKYESTEYVIKSILQRAFENSPIKSIHFPEDSQITRIEHESFLNSKIESFTVPSNVTIIGNSAFANCENLKIFKIPENSKLRSIDNNAFNGTSIESIFIPEYLDTLNSLWCQSTPKLQKIKVSPKNPYYSSLDDDMLIEKSNQTNEYDMLLFCNRHIEEVIIPSFIKFIGCLSFNQCSHIQSIKFQNDSKLSIINESAFSLSSIKSITIPKHLIKICEYAFAYCENLYSIEIPENSELKEICNNAFLQTSIESLFIPENLVDLEESWCASTNFLINVNVHPNNKRYKKYGDNLIIGKSSIENVFYDSIVFCNRDVINIKIPNFIQIIEPNAFEACFYIQNIEIQENSQLQFIKSLAFNNSSIKKFTITSNLIQIDAFAFDGCLELKKVEFQENSKLEIIGANAFSETEIEYFSIPPSVKEIEYDAFDKCYDLQIIEIVENSMLSSIDASTFGECDAIIMIPVNLESIIQN